MQCICLAHFKTQSCGRGYQVYLQTQEVVYNSIGYGKPCLATGDVHAAVAPALVAILPEGFHISTFCHWEHRPAANELRAFLILPVPHPRLDPCELQDTNLKGRLNMALNGSTIAVLARAKFSMPGGGCCWDNL